MRERRTFEPNYVLLTVLHRSRSAGWGLQSTVDSTILRRSSARRSKHFRQIRNGAQACFARTELSI